MIRCLITIETIEAQLALLPDHQQHTGVEDGRVGTTKDTDEQRTCKRTYACPTKERQSAQGKEHGERGVERTGHRLHEACIHNLLERLRCAALHVLADTVKHHNRVMDRETYDRQQRRDKQGIDLDA